MAVGYDLAPRIQPKVAGMQLFPIGSVLAPDDAALARPFRAPIEPHCVYPSLDGRKATPMNDSQIELRFRKARLQDSAPDESGRKVVSARDISVMSIAMNEASNLYCLANHSQDRAIEHEIHAKVNAYDEAERKALEHARSQHPGFKN